MYYYAILLGYVSFSENTRIITRKKKKEKKSTRRKEKMEKEKLNQ